MMQSGARLSVDQRKHIHAGSSYLRFGAMRKRALEEEKQYECRVGFSGVGGDMIEDRN